MLSLFFTLGLVLLASSLSVCARPGSGQTVDSTELQGTAGTIKVLPETADIDQGEEVTVYVWLENVGDYYGVDFKLNYDESLVSVPTGEVTPLWDVFDGSHHFEIRNVAEDGTVWYALTNINPAEPFTGTGRICSITFRGDAIGTSSLDFSSAEGSTRHGETLLPAQVGGSLAVQSSDGSPTPTPEPTYALPNRRLFIPMILNGG
ncbi:MAG: cohesin domain-containing protein [Anaerolineae bacterium]